jgi:hypothetical protein
MQLHLRFLILYFSRKIMFRSVCLKNRIKLFKGSGKKGGITENVLNSLDITMTMPRDRYNQTDMSIVINMDISVPI